MHSEEEFRAAIKKKQVPLLVLDQKWHRLFAVHGKTEDIKDAESYVSGMLARQGKLNSDLKEYKKLKNMLMESIVQNMDDSKTEGMDAARENKLAEDKRLIEELNEKMEACEDELIELPSLIRDANEELMLLSMDYFYSKLRVNKEEAAEIEEWITQVRIDLKKNIIRKQNREINNREIYAYLHDIWGAEVLDLFDIRYEQEAAETEAPQS